MSNISESTQERIKLHKVYNSKDVIEKITNKISDKIEAVYVLNPDYFAITVRSNFTINRDEICNAINDAISLLTTYQYPELLYSISYINQNTLIISL